MRRAHPRSRGENCGTSNVPMGDVGSSPLTRGKRHGCHGVLWVLGLIPAHAGKTSIDNHCPEVAGAHPRSRGENYRHMQHDEALGGSSPLTRGKPPGPDLTPTALRLIPAHAGTTYKERKQAEARAAHPRSRGENAPHLRIQANGPGSSPLTRGKHIRVRLSSLVAGLIPAHAGKTSPCGRRFRAWPAHPRSRGENGDLASGRVAGQGSSPLTRGKHERRVLLKAEKGLIPAHAGKT